jgi:predicted sugar kinase
MLFEVVAPACLPLGLVRLKEKGPAAVGLLGVALQQPLVQLSCQARRGLSITGGRADRAHPQARRFLQYHELEAGAEVQIEHAIPAFMGLGSEAVLGLSVAQGLAWLHGLPMDDTPLLAQAAGIGPQHALEIWGYDRGGVLLVGTQAVPGETVPRLVRRHVIEQPEPHTWVFALFFPRVPQNTSPILEEDRLDTLIQAAPGVSLETGRICREVLWPALDAADITAFAQAITTLQQANEEALARAGTPLPPHPETLEAVQLMREAGALACGQVPTGLAAYGLIEGGSASRELRRKLREHVGIGGGIVMAGIVSTGGAQYTFKKTRHDYLKA